MIVRLQDVRNDGEEDLIHVFQKVVGPMKKMFFFSNMFNNMAINHGQKISSLIGSRSDSQCKYRFLQIN